VQLAVHAFFIVVALIYFPRSFAFCHKLCSLQTKGCDGPFHQAVDYQKQVSHECHENVMFCKKKNASMNNIRISVAELEPVEQQHFAGAVTGILYRSRVCKLK
jgi:hypothetical protein